MLAQLPPLKPQAGPQIQAPQLKPLVTGYTAEIANAGFQGSANAGGVAWQCAAGRCTASGPVARPTVQVCSELVRTVGALRSFAYGQSALGPNELGQCNTAVATAPKPAGALPPLSVGAAPTPPGMALPARKPSGPMPDLKPLPVLQPPLKPGPPPAAAASGTVRTPVEITTGALSMTGNRFAPVTITTSALSMTGNRFAPVTITTSALSMTGTRFGPVNITTSPLSMTGNRFAPVTITTTGLSMTGNRFVPVTITTSPLSMTGTR